VGFAAADLGFSVPTISCADLPCVNLAEPARVVPRLSLQNRRVWSDTLTPVFLGDFDLSIQLPYGRRPGNPLGIFIGASSAALGLANGV
jgi:hypothetical protein